MCNFMSGIVLKTGDIICEPDFTDSHEDLIQFAKINDNETALHGQFLCRFEFIPPKNTETILDLATWELKADENVIPDWWDTVKVRKYCERKVNSMFITDARDIVFGGCWILSGNSASLKKLVSGRIKYCVNGATLVGANLAGANLTGANLVGANLTRADLAGANLAGATLTGANLYGANLARADLTGANLGGATLTRATLTRANLYGANLTRATLYGANLAYADLTGAYVDTVFPLPDGWARTKDGIVTRTLDK
jgi:uncharacterized protein YjbI with pentapeptide repeats